MCTAALGVSLRSAIEAWHARDRRPGAQSEQYFRI
jgi:hypothetical protein